MENFLMGDINISLVNDTEKLVSLPYHPVTTLIEKYIIPVNCLLGFIGNTLATVVLLQKPLRKSSCCIFLASRGLSDNGFLSTLLIIWISQTFSLQIGTLSGSCKVIIFLSYICGFVSVWLVVLVTFENYIRTCKPYIVKRICTAEIAKIVVALLCITSVCLYNFPFWAMSADNCDPLMKYHETVEALIYTDTVITLVVPLICIISLLVAIVCDLIKSYNIRKRTSTTRTENPLAKMTKMLLAVTLTFFCLNLPSHIYRLIIMISSLVQTGTDHEGYSIQEEAIQQITMFMSYLSFSVNIIVYTVFGSKFRRKLLEILHLRKPELERNSRRNLQRIDDNTKENSSKSATIRSLTVLLKDNEYFSELEPLRRAYTQ